MTKVYVATFHGDLDLPPMVGTTLESLLTNMQEQHGFGDEIKEYDGDDVYISYATPDPEDDKIEVWEYDTDAQSAKVVWGFWGWHWTIPEGLEQGMLPGHTKPLYALTEV